jgi:hypothetical protein
MPAPVQNINAVCFCHHKMVSHLAQGGRCGHCDCDHFSEKLVEKCRYCKELLSIQTAPDDEVMRLSYNALGLLNYAHRECHAKHKDQPKKSPFKRQPHPKQERAMSGIHFDTESLEALSNILFKLGAFEMDGSVSDRDWAPDEETLLVKLSHAV